MPENRSSTRASSRSIRDSTSENMASRIRSDVGRMSRPFGTRIDLRLSRPAIMRIGISENGRAGSRREKTRIEVRIDACGIELNDPQGVERIQIVQTRELAVR